MGFVLQILRIHILSSYYRAVFLFFLSVLSSTVFSQFYEYGQDPGRVRWSHFSSEHYRLIYPKGLDSLAMNFADKLEYFYPYQSEVLDFEHEKMPVIFHNESSFSNGVFVWAPKRLEVFTNPDPNGYPQDWMTQLALHEGRHAFQVAKLNQGFSKNLSFIAGEQAVGAITGMLPLWYLEGDAVDAETRFSNTGRGGLPSFEMGLKAILLEKGERYSFSKASLGSYKEYVPNHYQLGYLMVRYGRRTFGDSFWTDLEDYTAKKPYLIVPSWFSMKKYGINSKSQFYHSALDLYSTHWDKSLQNRLVQSGKEWSPRGQHYTSYNFPQWINDSMIIAYKTGIDQIPEFVIIDADGSEQRVFRPGFLNSGRFSYRNNFIVWDEWIPDIRWSNRNFSVLKLFNLETGKPVQLGSGTRYYSPAISKSGKYIAAIEQRTDHSFFVVVLDLNGDVIHSLRSPENYHIQHPGWMEGDSAIVVTLTDLNGEHLFACNPESGEWERLFSSGFYDISFPTVSGANIYFGSTLSGIDNIYCYNLTSNEFKRVTSSVFGAFEPSLSTESEKMIFADYHSDGFRAVSMTILTSRFFNAETQSGFHEQIDFEKTPGERMVIDSAASMKRGDYNPASFNKLLHSVNIHSWLPLYFDYMNPEAALRPERIPVSLGVTLLSQNLLSTVTGMVGYEFRDKIHYLHSGIRLKGRYPIVDLRIDYGGYPLVDRINSLDNVPVNPDRVGFSADTYIPFRLNTGKYISVLQPFFGFTYSSDILPDESRTSYVSGISKLHYRIYFSSYLRKGRKDILPRLGLSFNAGFINAPFNSYNFGNLSYSAVTAYFPGFIPHQTVRLRYSAQTQNPENYFLQNSIPMPRGKRDIYGIQMKLISADYTFPLAYTDLSLGSVIYIKRVRGNVWVDHFRGRDIYLREPTPSVEDLNYSSLGADLLMDFHLFRFFLPFSVGLRVSYLPQSEEFKPELLFTIEVN